MLEGNEFEQKVGSGGNMVVDIQGNGVGKAHFTYGEGALKGTISVELDVIALLAPLVAKTDNKFDDSIFAIVKGALGR